MKEYNIHHNDNYMTVVNCNDRMLGDRLHTTLREHGRPDFGVQYIAEGKGYYEDNGQIKTIEKGSILLFFPKVRQHYYFLEEDKTRLMWTHFYGDACKILEPLKSDKTIHIALRNPKEFERILKKLVTAYNEKGSYHETVCNEYMQILLALIMQNAMDRSIYTDKPINESLDKVIAYMHLNYDQTIDLELYSKMCYMSRSRFIHVFKNYTGDSPYHFQLKIRIERAIEMLTNTSMTVSECAEAVGFNDTSYFCRIFKKITARNPSNYREK
jgi:AraC-like DNA-binding protein